MFPKKTTYHNLTLFHLISLNPEEYESEFSQIYREKKYYYILSLILICPIVLVIAVFGTLHFKSPWWMFFVYSLLSFWISFFVMSLPVYRTLTTGIKEREMALCHKIDEKLTLLAQEGAFSKEAKAKRLLNQEFNLVKLEPVRQHHLNMIQYNQSLTSVEAYLTNNKDMTDMKSLSIIYEKKTLSPIILATLHLIDRENKTSYQLTVPLEFKLVNSIISEQLTYLNTDNYWLNPIIYIDEEHFMSLYTENIGKTSSLIVPKPQKKLRSLKRA